MKHFLPAFVAAGAILAGCSEPVSTSAAPVAAKPSTAMPHFRVVQVLDGRLIEVGPRDEVVVQPTTMVGYYGDEINASSAFYSFQNRVGGGQTRMPKLAKFAAGKSSAMPGHSFLDSKGETMPYLHEGVIQHIEDGQSISLTPLRIPSDHLRYYTSPKGVYCNDHKTGVIHRVSEEPMGGSAMGGNGYLAYTTRGEGASKVILIADGQKPRVVYTGVQCTIADIRDDGGLTVMDGKQFVSVDPSGKATPIPNAAYSVTRFSHDGHDWLIGFSRTIQDGKPSNSFMAIWDEQNRPVRLLDLCPDLKAKVVSVKNMSNGRFLCNKNGLLAFELSGSNPAKNLNGETIPNSSQDVVKTYVLEVVKP